HEQMTIKKGDFVTFLCNDQKKETAHGWLQENRFTI
ncbi:uncharacterized protein METZ01_LOCUS81517, partial [marine metagenome]